MQLSSKGKSDMMEKNFESTCLFQLGILVKPEKQVNLVYGSETWPMKVQHEAKLDRNDLQAYN